MALERLTAITQVRGMEGDDQTKKYVVGALQKLPWPDRGPKEQDATINDALVRMCALRSVEELSRSFTRFRTGTTDELDEEADAIWNIEQRVASAYGLDPIECARESISANSEPDAIAGIKKALLIGASNSNPKSSNSRMIAYAVGTTFGRWDIRYATGERLAPELLDPFAPLPVCPPGKLQGDDGLPLSPEAGRRLRVEGRYPLDVAWDGILVDEPEHPLDIERRVRDALAVIWGDRADALEQEACELLGTPSLREWFRRPTGLFADHLKRYSKSRRQAPIYWRLSTASGGYTLWIYYHRLTDQTLFTAVNDFVDPKLDDVSKQLAGLRQKATRTKSEERDLEGLADLQAELQDFRNELLRLAQLPWKPNLNDGVQITAAPLWKLFRLPKWQKTLKETWQKLENGDYDWAHLAYTLWPRRVRDKCKTDKSLAIAHDLEGLYKAPPQPAKRNRRRGSAVEAAQG